MRTLVSWIGDRDLVQLGVGLDRPGPRGTRAGTASPLLTLLKHEPFERVYVLCDEPDDVVEEVRVALGDKARVHGVGKLDDPRDVGEIYGVVTRFLEEIHAPGIDMHFLLNSGTRAMTSVWLLVGKTIYPASFRHVKGETVMNPTVPLDLQVSSVAEELLQATVLSLRGASLEGVVGESATFSSAVGRAHRVASHDVNVLLLGESGTGKEVIAQAMHGKSQRAEGPFVAVNCANFTSEVFASEVFGHKRGSFTGATADREGYMASAHGGTLFLDEIGECSPENQVRLLRSLQPPRGRQPTCRQFQPLGSDTVREADVRILAATNRDLMEAIAAGDFREDLYYRLNSFTIIVPPLRERGQDILLLAESMLDELNDQFAQVNPGYVAKTLDASARDALLTYRWPGNVRELQNVLTQLSILVEGPRIGGAGVRETLAGSASTGYQAHETAPSLDGLVNLDQVVDQFRRDYIQEAMRQTGGNKAKAGELLGYNSRQAFYQEVKRLEA